VAESHLDHGLTPAHVEYLVERFADRTSFFIESFELPAELAGLSSALYGPLAGDPPVDEADVVYAVRGERSSPSRLVRLGARTSRVVTVIAGPGDDGGIVLYTAYGGPAAPREPGDPSIAGNAEALEESRAFWAQHALASL
jgi:hypothetical protein